MTGREAIDADWLARLPAVSPRVFPSIDSIVPRRAYGLDAERAWAMRAAYEAHERELPRFPKLADVGFAMLAADRSTAERREACVWLTLFPGDAMADALAGVLLDDAAPAEVRNQAAWSLGFRQVQARHESLHWPASAVGRANDALVEAWRRGLHRTLSQLPGAARHVDDPRLFACLRESLDDAWPAVEAFGDAPLARAILERLAAAPQEHVHRAIRLAAHVLGAEAAPALEAFARDAPQAPRLEALLAAIAVGSSWAREALDADIAKMMFPAPTLAKREAYAESGGASYHVRALRTARTTATLAPDARRVACAAACADFALLARVDAIHETYLYAMWRHAAVAAHDAGAVAACVEGSPRAIAEQPALATPYVVALCAAGRFADAWGVAPDEATRGRAAWEAARLGHPHAALRLCAPLRERSAWSAAAEALACFLVGRVELAQASLDTFHSDAQTRWEAESGEDPVARAVIARDLVALASMCAPPPVGAGPDAIDPAVVDEAERRLMPRLDGRCVFLAGFDAGGQARAAARARLEAMGARVLDAPFGGVDLVVVPDDRPDAPIDARLAVRNVPVVTLSRVLQTKDH